MIPRAGPFGLALLLFPAEKFLKIYSRAVTFSRQFCTKKAAPIE